ncbi:MAG: DAK2 domain-containing protein, partial [Devosia sp.]
MAIDVNTLRAGIERMGRKLEAEHAMLTELDGRVGDGDLGLTLLKAFRAMDGIKDALPDDLGMALFQLGQATTRVSSSSFGTLMATGLLAVAKASKGREAIDWSELSPALTTAREAMQARGKANPGDKTVLDALHAIETG